VHAVRLAPGWDPKTNAGAKVAERLQIQCSGSLAIHIKVAPDRDLFPLLDRRPQPGDYRIQGRQFAWFGGRISVGIEKALRLMRIDDPSPGKKRRQKLAQVTWDRQRPPQRVWGGNRLGFDPSGHGRLLTVGVIIAQR
jgi:hypothetical protein